MAHVTTDPARLPAFGRIRRALALGPGVAAGWLVLAPVAFAHGSAAPAPELAGVLLAWSFDPSVIVPVVLAAAGYLWAVRSVDRAHPDNRVPTIRSVCWRRA